MKTKIASFFFFLAVIMTANAATNYTKDPTMCNGIKGVYCDNKKVATFSNLPLTVGKTWCAYAHDDTWAAYDDISSASWVPGQTTYTTAVIPGTNLLNGSGTVALSIWHNNNNLTGNKSEDCSANIKPSNFDASCTPKTDNMCNNYDAKILKDNIITYTGLNNYSIGVWCGFTDDSWASYADLTPILIGGVDKYDLDASKYSYASGIKKGPINLPINGSLDMLAHAKMPDQCKKTFTLKGTGGTTPKSVFDVDVNNVVAVYPNPALASDNITIKGRFDALSVITINNLNGVVVGSKSVSAVESLQLNLSEFSLNAGIYVIKIQSGDDTYVAKLIIK